MKCRVHLVCDAWRKFPHPHVSLAKVTAGTHVVYYATEATGVHVIHYGTVWAILVFLCVELAMNAQRH